MSTTQTFQDVETTAPEQYVVVYAKKIEKFPLKVSFEAITKNDVHVAFFTAPCHKEGIEIVFGGWNNTKSCIRNFFQGKNLVEHLDTQVCTTQATGVLYQVSVSMVEHGVLQVDAFVNHVLHMSTKVFCGKSLHGFGFSAWGTKVEYKNIKLEAPQ